MMNIDDVARLQAAEMHDDRTHEQAEEAMIVREEERGDRTVLTCGHYELVVMKDRTRRPIYFSDVSVQTMGHLNACCALLQRAKEIMMEDA